MIIICIKFINIITQIIDIFTDANDYIRNTHVHELERKTIQ